jgi:hypothetical protein
MRDAGCEAMDGEQREAVEDPRHKNSGCNSRDRACGYDMRGGKIDVQELCSEPNGTDPAWQDGEGCNLVAQCPEPRGKTPVDDCDKRGGGHDPNGHGRCDDHGQKTADNSSESDQEQDA